MSGPRKKWKLTYRGVEGHDPFTSQKKAYEFVRHLIRSYANNPAGMSPHVTVWVDERSGRGWQRFEELDLSDPARWIP